MSFKHWKRHHEDEALELVVQGFQTLFQTIEHLKERFMSELEDVSTAAVAADEAAGAYIDDLTAQLAAANTTDPADQAALQAIRDASDALLAKLPAPAPAPEPEPAPVTNPDGSTTNPDGSVTNADGSVTPAPAV